MKDEEIKLNKAAKIFKMFLYTEIIEGFWGTILLGPYFWSLDPGETFRAVWSSFLIAAIVGVVIMSPLAFLFNLPALFRYFERVETNRNGIDIPYTDCRHKKEILVPLTYQPAFDLCVKSLSALPSSMSVKQIRKDEAVGKIEAHTKMSFSSLGATIWLELKRKDDTSILVDVFVLPVKESFFLPRKHKKIIRKIELFLKRNTNGNLAR